MWIDAKPFPYLEQWQFAGEGNGEIYFLDKNIPEEKKDWLRKEYKKWWNDKQDKIYKTGLM